MVGSAAGQRERIISEGMTVPVKGIAMFESRDGGTAEVVGLLNPLQWKTQTSPFGIVCLCSQNSLWIHLFPKKGKISHKSNKIPRVSCFPGHEPRLHRQMLVVPEQEGFLKLGLSAVFLGAAVSCTCCVISLCLSFTAVKTIEVAKRTPSELMFDWKVYSNSRGNTTVPLTVQLHPWKHFQFLFSSGSHGLC